MAASRPPSGPGAGGRGADGPDAGGPGAGGPGGGAEPGEESAQEAARLICLRLLAAGPRTRAQLSGALHRRGVPGEVADTVLGRFAEAGLVDDAAFARAWVETRHHGRGLARARLAAELHRRGVAEEEVRAAVSTVAPADELAAARRLLAQRIAGTRGLPAPARMRRLMSLLARRGYAPGVAYQVVREALEQDSRVTGDSAGGPGGGDPGGAGDDGAWDWVTGGGQAVGEPWGDSGWQEDGD